ncbi:SDR family oxidoreductase [Rhodopseudomonas sp. G2_2311]|uniref:dTDP-4-dehydrorhamnose reductase family protein n=1 Tax=Rhodopseudomonas sp. G2_2311 TaxID=3114287 RepID=UPI0039C5C013
MSNTRILVLGAAGMLGNAVYRFMSQIGRFDVRGTVRSTNSVAPFSAELRDRLMSNVDLDNFDTLSDVLRKSRPDVVINCVGLVKQLSAANDPLLAVPVNTMLPHRLARLCALGGARLVHVSTDCVFDGKKGSYTESDVPNAYDLYGRSKLLGEVDYPNAVTLRTSIIGHELSGAHGLIDWFLSQKGPVRGFSRAIFSGLPTVELARVMAEYVIPARDLTGVYHVSAEPISKLDLLRLVATRYGHTSEIVHDDEVVIDRSLNSGRFRRATGYEPPSWPTLVSAMHDFG